MYVTGRKHPRRLWCAHKTMLAAFEKMTNTELAEAYRTERRDAPADDTPDDLRDFNA